MKKLSIALGCLTLAPMAQAETPVLNILTYDSFAAEWGPGPAIEAGFEATCACDLRWTMAGDGAAMLARLRLEGAGSEADVVVGLDTSLTESARQSGLFAPHTLTLPHDLPVPFQDAEFLPYDWGWFAFVHNKTLPNPPKSFTELAASDLKVVIQDPRSSTPGLGLVLWVKQAYGPQAAEIWTTLADNILTVTPGWTEAYGMFLAGEADMVLSYTTSPAYHLIAETDDTKTAALFTEGHYLQIEVAGMLAASDQPDLARAFLTYLGGDAAQSVIPTTNWMYPAKTPAAGLPEGFNTLIQPTKSLLLSSTEAEAIRAEAIAEWQAALAQ
ncbi:MAG: thiamine ABC transporter substrate binding subunit [Paracoccaceae bacterium]